nr:hypothetical protein [Cellulosimicrobium funkei]
MLGHRLDPAAEVGVEVLLVTQGDGACDRGPERPREREPRAGDEVDGRADLGEPGGGLGTDEPGAEHGDRAPRGIGAEQGTQPLGVPRGVQVHHAGLPAVGARERRDAVHGRPGARHRAGREDDGGGGELAPVREDDGPPRGVQPGRARPHELDVERHRQGGLLRGEQALEDRLVDEGAQVGLPLLAVHEDDATVEPLAAQRRHGGAPGGSAADHHHVRPVHVAHLSSLT